MESYTVEEKGLPLMANESTKSYLLESLLKKYEQNTRYSFSNDKIRRCIAGTKDYQIICTSNIPFGIKVDYYCKNGNIICPFTIKQWEKNNHLSKKEFTETICASEEFHILVDHVAKYPACGENNSKEKIEAEYRKFIEELYDVGNAE